MWIQGDPVAPGVYEGDVRELPRAPRWKKGQPIREVPKRVYPRPEPPTPLEPSPADPLLEPRSRTDAGKSPRAFTPPDLEIAGIGFTGAFPPDTVGDVGPNHYIQMANSGRGSRVRGSPNYFMRHRDDEVHNAGSNDATMDFLEIFEFHVDFANPLNSTFALRTTIGVAEFDSNLCGLMSFAFFPQPGTAVTLDPLREVLMWRLQYRNFGTHETLVGNFVTDVDNTDHGGIWWFESMRSGTTIA